MVWEERDENSGNKKAGNKSTKDLKETLTR